MVEERTSISTGETGGGGVEAGETGRGARGTGGGVEEEAGLAGGAVALTLAGGALVGTGQTLVYLSAHVETWEAASAVVPRALSAGH